MQIHEIKTITGEFNQYMEDVYEGQDISEDQREECKKAFLAGAMALLVKMDETSSLPTAVAIPVIQLIRDDLINSCKKLAEMDDQKDPEKPANN